MNTVLKMTLLSLLFVSLTASAVSEETNKQKKKPLWPNFLSSIPINEGLFIGASALTLLSVPYAKCNIWFLKKNYKDYLQVKNTLRTQTMGPNNISDNLKNGLKQYQSKFFKELIKDTFHLSFATTTAFFGGLVVYKHVADGLKWRN